MRGVVVMWTVLAVAVLAIVALFVWPGYLTTTAHCDPSKVASESINGRFYCETPAVRPAERCANETVLSSPTNWTAFYGFRFGLNWAVGSNCGIAIAELNLTVVEPNGTTFHGHLLFASYRFAEVLLWTAPDNETAVDWRTPVNNSGLLLVASGLP